MPVEGSGRNALRIAIGATIMFEEWDVWATGRELRT